MAADEDAADQAASKSIAAGIRNAKKAGRPTKITEAAPKKTAPKSKSSASKKKRSSAFDDHEGMRAKPVKVNLAKKGHKNKGKAPAKRR